MIDENGLRHFFYMLRTLRKLERSLSQKGGGVGVNLKFQIRTTPCDISFLKS